MATLIQGYNWFGMSARHFLLLSNLCHTVRETIDDAVRRLNVQSFVTLHMYTRREFHSVVNTTLNRTIKDLIVNFDFLTSTSRLWTQIDQPLGFSYHDSELYVVEPFFTVTTNESNTEQMPQVDSYHWKKMIVRFLREKCGSFCSCIDSVDVRSSDHTRV